MGEREGRDCVVSGEVCLISKFVFRGLGSEYRSRLQPQPSPAKALLLIGPLPAEASLALYCHLRPSNPFSKRSPTPNALSAPAESQWLKTSIFI